MFRSPVLRAFDFAPGNERLAQRKQADDAMNLRRFERLVQSQRRQNGRQPFRKHRLACARRTDEQAVISGYTYPPRLNATRRDKQKPTTGEWTYASQN